MTALVERLRTLITLFSQSPKPLEWGGWQTRFYSTVSTIEPTHLLVVRIRCFHVGKYSKHADECTGYEGPLVEWELGQVFDPTKHLHIFRLTVEDPMNRWDGRRVCDVFIIPQDGTLFELMETLFAQASKSACYPSQLIKDPLAACIASIYAA